jgi:hypothetical protein
MSTTDRSIFERALEVHNPTEKPARPLHVRKGVV